MNPKDYDDVETSYNPSPGPVAVDDVVPAIIITSQPQQSAYNLNQQPQQSAYNLNQQPQQPAYNLNQQPLPFTESTASQYVSGRIGIAPPEREAPETVLLGSYDQSHLQQLQDDAAKYPFYNPRKYRIYFDVDTKDVLWRVGSSLIGPFKPDFMQVTWERPDLYGPFWVATTLIFVIAVAANYASYLQWDISNSTSPPPSAPGPSPSSSPVSQQWFNDYGKMGVSALLIYGYIFLLGVGLWFAAKYFKGEIKLGNIFCIYGYSLTMFIPVSFACIVPLDWLRWVLVMSATGLTGLFLVANFKTTIYSVAPAKASMLLLVIAALHLGLGFCLKLVFFSY